MGDRGSNDTGSGQGHQYLEGLGSKDGGSGDYNYLRPLVRNGFNLHYLYHVLATLCVAAVTMAYYYLMVQSIVLARHHVARY